MIAGTRVEPIGERPRRTSSGTGPIRDQLACAWRTSSAAARQPAVVVDLAADRVGRQRFLQHRREPRRRRQRRRRQRPAGPPSDCASVFDALDERFHPLAVGVGIEIGAGERRRPPRDDARERRGEPLVERERAIAIDAARGDLLLPAAAQTRAPSRQRPRRAGGRVERPRAALRPSGSSVDRRLTRERLELGADRLARRDALGARDVVALRVAREKASHARAEPLPDRLRPALLHRPDRLPLGLQPLDLGRRGVPVGRLGERLGLRAQRFLLREVLGPDRLALRRDRPGAG